MSTDKIYRIVSLMQPPPYNNYNIHCITLVRFKQWRVQEFVMGGGGEI